MPLDHLALVARRADILELHKTITIRKIDLGRLPLPGQFTDSRLKHNPILSMKEVYLLSLELQLLPAEMLFFPGSCLRGNKE